MKKRLLKCSENIDYLREIIWSEKEYNEYVAYLKEMCNPKYIMSETWRRHYEVLSKYSWEEFLDFLIADGVGLVVEFRNAKGELTWIESAFNRIKERIDQDMKKSVSIIGKAQPDIQFKTWTVLPSNIKIPLKIWNTKNCWQIFAEYEKKEKEKNKEL